MEPQQQEVTYTPPPVPYSIFDTNFSLVSMSLFLLLFVIKVSADTSLTWWAVFLPLLVQIVFVGVTLIAGNDGQFVAHPV